MNLKSYFALQRGNQKALSQATGCSKSYLSQLASGTASCGEKLAVRLEVATDGQVMRWDLRPDDWWQIWPELIENSQAPSIPVSSVVSSPEPSGFGSLPNPSGLGFSSDEVRCG